MLWISTLFFGLIVNLAPLALGSNRPLPWAYNGVLVGLALVLVWLAWITNRNQRVKLHIGYIALPLVLIGLIIGWIGFQLLPTAGLLTAHPNWQFSGTILGTNAQGRISLNPSESLWGLLRLLTSIAVFFGAYVISRSRDQANFLINMFLASACLYALYGLIRVSFEIDRILWWEGPYTTSVLTSSFVGRNNAATYFGIATLAALAMLMHQFKIVVKGVAESTVRYQLRAILIASSGSLGIYFVAFWLLLTSVLLTASRGGITATLLAIPVLFFLMHLRSGFHRHKHRSPGMRFFASFAIVALVLIAVEVSGANFIQRLFSQGMESGLRLSVYSDTINAIRDHVWLGTGYGTFQDVFPIYRSDVQSSPIYFDKAHNDYLELFLGLGVPAACAFLLALFLIVKRCLSGYFQRQRDAVYPLIAVTSTVIVFLHSFVDFSLQIQAIAMCYAMVLGIGAAQSISSRA